ncbi:hypothetical protein SGLAM104S_09784 [Streptomyces glaucescens]
MDAPICRTVSANAVSSSSYSVAGSVELPPIPGRYACGRRSARRPVRAVTGRPPPRAERAPIMVVDQEARS